MHDAWDGNRWTTLAKVCVDNEGVPAAAAASKLPCTVTLVEWHVIMKVSLLLLLVNVVEFFSLHCRRGKEVCVCLRIISMCLVCLYHTVFWHIWSLFLCEWHFFIMVCLGLFCSTYFNSAPCFFSKMALSLRTLFEKKNVKL